MKLVLIVLAILSLNHFTQAAEETRCKEKARVYIQQIAEVDPYINDTDSEISLESQLQDAALDGAWIITYKMNTSQEVGNANIVSVSMLRDDQCALAAVEVSGS